MPAEVKASRPVPKAALKYLAEKEVRISFDSGEIYREEHDTGFTVAKVMEGSLVSDIKTALMDALEKGGTIRDFAKQIRPALEKEQWLGKKEVENPKTGEVKDVAINTPHRLKTIFNTNMRTARAAGQWDRIQKTARARPFLMYELGPSTVHRKEHERWAGKILRWDDPWWDEHFPPNDYGCKCRVRQLSATEAARRGGVSETPPTEYKFWTNPATGERIRAPTGVRPGFDRNPGKTAGTTGKNDQNAPAARRKFGLGAHAPARHLTEVEQSHHRIKPNGKHRRWLFDEGWDTSELVRLALARGQATKVGDFGFAPSRKLPRVVLDLGVRIGVDTQTKKAITKVELRSTLVNGSLTYHVFPRMDPE